MLMQKHCKKVYDLIFLVFRGIITDDKFKLTFNYNFLAPPLLDAEILQEFDEKKKDLENADLSNPRPETEALWYMSESIQHRQI